LNTKCERQLYIWVGDHGTVFTMKGQSRP